MDMDDVRLVRRRSARHGHKEGDLDTLQEHPEPMLSEHIINEAQTLIPLPPSHHRHYCRAQTLAPRMTKTTQSHNCSGGYVHHPEESTTRSLEQVMRLAGDAQDHHSDCYARERTTDVDTGERTGLRSNTQGTPCHFYPSEEEFPPDIPSTDLLFLKNEGKPPPTNEVVILFDINHNNVDRSDASTITESYYFRDGDETTICSWDLTRNASQRSLFRTASQRSLLLEFGPPTHRISQRNLVPQQDLVQQMSQRNLLASLSQRNLMNLDLSSHQHSRLSRRNLLVEKTSITSPPQSQIPPSRKNGGHQGPRSPNNKRRNNESRRLSTQRNRGSIRHSPRQQQQQQRQPPPPPSLQPQPRQLRQQRDFRSSVTSSPRRQLPPQQLSSVSTRTPPRQPVQIEVAKGQYEPVRGAQETLGSVTAGAAEVVTCLACQVALVTVADCLYVLCPDCRIVSPMPPLSPHGGGASVPQHGIGLGLRL